MRPFLELDLRVVALTALTLVACNGDSGEGGDASASFTASGTATTSASATTDAATTTSDETTGMSASGSTATTTTTGTTAVSESESESASSTTAGADQCALEQPPAYAGTIDDACAAEPQLGTFNPVVEWTRSTFSLAPDSGDSLSTPIVTTLSDDNMDGVIDGADVPDVVFVTVIGAFQADTPGTLRALSGESGAELWAIADQQIYGQAFPAVGDLDDDGMVEIIAATVDYRVKCFEHDGTLKWTSMPLPAEEIRADAPAITDMDHDGVPELIYGRVILSGADGSVLGIGAHGRGSAFSNGGRRFSTSFAVDADANGTEEVIVGNAMYAPDGAALWSNGQADGFVAAGDFDDDGEAEVVVTGLGHARLQDTDGTVIWDVLVPDAAGGGGPATIADFNGDSAPEIGIAGRDSYVVLDGDGVVLWKAPVVDVSSGITGSSVYDFEGDGIADVVYADETTLWVFSGVDGAVKLAFTEHGSGTSIEYPVIADIDGDGETEIALVHNKINNGKTYSGITVVGDADHSWIPARKTWNQYPYYITNIADDGSIPANAALNWTLYNNFRAGDPSPKDGTKAPDLVVDGVKCEALCYDDQQVFWVHLGNEGASPLTAGATIEIYGVKDMVETLIESLPFTDPLAPGEFTAGIFVGVDPLAYDSFLVRAVAKEEECKADNNEVAFEPPFCTIPG